MKALGIGLCVVFLVSAAPLIAGNGTIPAGSNGSGVEDAIASTWNVDWFCSKQPNTLYAWQNTGACTGRRASLSATVTSGSGTTNVQHSYEYNLACSGGFITQSIRFDGGPLTTINTGAFTFNLSGSDTIRLVTTEGPAQISAPAMGFVAFSAAGLALALLLLWRVRSPRAGHR
jgi:hypothetical protein